MIEEALPRQLQKGCREGLAQAIRTYTPYVSAVAFRAAGGAYSPEDLEELTSDVFLSLWPHRKNLDSAKGLRAYLAVFAQLKAVDLYGKKPPLPLSVQPPDARPSPMGGRPGSTSPSTIPAGCSFGRIWSTTFLWNPLPRMAGTATGAPDWSKYPSTLRAKPDSMYSAEDFTPKP